MKRSPWQPRLGRCLALALLLAAAPSIPTVAFAQPRPVIEKAADLPRFTYRVAGRLEDIVRSPERFAPLAAAIRRDTESVLARYDIPDKATRRDLLTTLALLDFLDGRYAAAAARAEEARALHDKPADRAIASLRLRAMADAAQRHPLNSDAYRAAVAAFIERELAAHPFALIGNEVRELKMSAELVGEALVLGPAREVMQPIASASGQLSSDFASGLVGARYGLVAVLPLKPVLVDVFSRYLAANTVAKVDIWAAREAVLEPGQGLAEVRIAVWDSGVDTALFPGQLALDPSARPLVVAHDRFSRPAQGELMPIPAALRSRLPQMAARTKGFSDLQSDIDSPEAAEVKRYLSTLPPERYRAAIEELGLAGNFEHGTHVAGIALAGNPYARLVVARIEFDHRLQPDPCPSRAGALREARASLDTVAFLQRHRVRVANMSWGGSVGGIESALEQCGIGKTPEARKKLAREYFEISTRALTQALRDAPEILFVAAAGNEDSDSSFTESVPAAIDLPNVLTVGAVDLAGDEAGFTSYGPTVRVHANGYQVESYLPGGLRVALSGTSMAAPQVANLAAKVLAVAPSLTPVEVTALIVDHAERTPDGRRVLIHPRKTLEAARRR